MDGDTLINSTTKATEYVEALVAQKRDLRVALVWAIIILRTVSKENYPFLMDALELRASKFDDYEDLKIFFNEKDKQNAEDNPFARFRRMMEGGA